MPGPWAALATAATSVLADVPVDPDSATARRWAREELADPVYHQQESLLARVIAWLRDRLAEAQNSLAGLDVRMAAAVVTTIVVVAVVVVLLVAGPVRRARRVRESVEVFVDDERSAAELRAAADAAAAAGRWTEAVLDRFRSLLRGLEERAVLAERPGWTADEATAEASALLPSCEADLRRASRLFDDVCYGDRPATAADDAWLRDVDRHVTATRPERPAAAPSDDEVDAGVPS